MTLTDYAYEIMEFLERNLVDDFEIDIRLVKDMIRDQRELMIYKLAKENKANAYGSMAQYKQKIIVDINEYEDDTCNTPDCLNSFYRLACSTEDLPEMITIYGNPAIYEIYLCTNDTDINQFKSKIKFGSKDLAEHVGNGRFNTNQIVSYYEDGKLCIATQNKTVSLEDKNLCVMVILKDPTTDPNFNEETDVYPMGKDWVYVQDYIVGKLLNKLQTPEDIINDSTDEKREQDVS